jgi:hypothetical protein
MLPCQAYQFKYSVKYLERICTQCAVKSHSYSPATHVEARNTHSLQFLLPHHRESVLDNPKISIKQSNLMGVYNLIITLAITKLIELRRLHYRSFGVINRSVFARFPDYISRFNLADLENRVYLDVSSNNRFNAAFFFARWASVHGALFTWSYSCTPDSIRIQMVWVRACGFEKKLICQICRSLARKIEYQCIYHLNL